MMFSSLSHFELLLIFSLIPVSFEWLQKAEKAGEERSVSELSLQTVSQRTVGCDLCLMQKAKP